ncbi:GNAT family N-acetyltransferase [Companilactobacillus sp. FL22-3]
MIDSIEISRTNRSSDFEAIKQVYYQTWRYSYHGLVPELLLDQLDLKTTWNPKTRWNNTLIATDNQKTIGVCTFGPARRQKYYGFGEIYSFYVLPKFQHQGIGQKLFQSALDILSKDYDSLNLIVLKNNLSARAFFEMYGFQETADRIAEQTKFGLLHEIVYTKE